MALAAGVVGWSAAAVAERSAVAWGVGVGGGLGVVLLAGGLVLRWPSAVTVGLALAGAAYGAALAIESKPIDDAAPVVAAVLFLAAELAWWSLELRERIAAEAGSHLRRLAFLLLLTLGALALGGSLLAVVDVVHVDGLAILLLGAAAAALAVSLALPRSR